MPISRRLVLQSAAAFSASALIPGSTRAAQPSFSPRPGPWRVFETVVRVDIAKPGEAQAWIPLPSVDEAEWMRPGESMWSAEGAAAEIVTDATQGTRLLHATWDKGAASRELEVRSRFATRDRAVALDGGTSDGATISATLRRRYTAPTELIPTDGIVKETSDRITDRARSELDQARAIYEWVVDNTFRNPKTRGCGIGDITYMLKSGDLSGKCADLNALYVGLARAAGLPARDVYGIRLCPSRFGYKSLGAATADITKAQHCRAEVFITGKGWIPVDPADVRKVVLEEPPGNLPTSDPKVVEARTALFGAWEGNWLAYNVSHDVALPGSSGPKLGFLMYPQVEIAEERGDPLDPGGIRYQITAHEILT